MVIEEKHGERCAAALTEALAARQPPHCPAVGRVPAADGVSEAAEKGGSGALRRNRMGGVYGARGTETSGSNA